MRRWLLIAISLAYPLLVYLGLSLFQARWIALLALGLFGLRLVALRLSRADLSAEQQSLFTRLGLPFKEVMFFFGTAVLLLLIFEAWSSSGQLLLFLPAVFNFNFLLLFGLTLIRPPSLAERIARLTTQDITDEHVSYCYTVTACWSGLFLFNTIIALTTALLGNLAIWTLFNGFIVYFLVAALFAGEATYRYWRFRAYNGSILDPFFRPFFPPLAEGDKGNDYP